MTEPQDHEALKLLPHPFADWAPYVQEINPERVVFFFSTIKDLEECISEWRKEGTNEVYNVLYSWFKSHQIEAQDKTEGRVFKITCYFRENTNK